MAEQTDIGERLLRFGTRVIKVVESLPKNLVGRTVGDRLLRSALSVGANFEEAQAAESKPDFVHKLQLALKELREAGHWLRVITSADIVPKHRLVSLMDESNQLVAMLSKAVARTKGKAKDQA